MAYPPSAQEIVAAVRHAFRAEPRLGPAFTLARIELTDDGLLLLEGEVADLAHKKLALLCAAAVSSVTELVDRVHVAAKPPARHVRAHIAETLASATDFAGFEIREDMAAGVLATAYEPVVQIGGSPSGRIDIEENNGVVTLNGTVPNLVHKRLAGVLAWRVPGVRDVINGIAVEPPEQDSPDQIETAVRVALDSNHALDASQIRVGVRIRTVRLTGLVPTEAARDLAEQDAWAVFGVDDVIDEIAVRP